MLFERKADDFSQFKTIRCIRSVLCLGHLSLFRLFHPFSLRTYLICLDLYVMKKKFIISFSLSRSIQWCGIISSFFRRSKIDYFNYMNILQFKNVSYFIRFFVVVVVVVFIPLLPYIRNRYPRTVCSIIFQCRWAGMTPFNGLLSS